MKKVLSLLAALGMVVVLGSVTFAEEAKKAAEPAKVEKKAPEKVMQHTGEIAAVDAKANTFTIRTKKKGEITCEVTADTKITAGKESKTFADIKAGDKVTCKCVAKDGKNVSKSIQIKAAEKKEEKKEEKKK